MCSLSHCVWCLLSIVHLSIVCCKFAHLFHCSFAHTWTISMLFASKRVELSNVITITSWVIPIVSFMIEQGPILRPCPLYRTSVSCSIKLVFYRAAEERNIVPPEANFGSEVSFSAASPTGQGTRGAEIWRC
jgi:hypothetical protein